MKYNALIIGTVVLIVAACATTAKPVADNEIGLSKTSVFEDPTPSAFDYPKTEPSVATALPRAWNSAPPQVPHKIDVFIPISTGKNLCLTCHDKPALIGKAKTKGIATPMPESHYYKAEDSSLKRSDARYVCVQCHTPQADVKELVGNTFTQ